MGFLDRFKPSNGSGADGGRASAAAGADPVGLDRYSDVSDDAARASAPVLPYDVTDEIQNDLEPDDQDMSRPAASRAKSDVVIEDPGSGMTLIFPAGVKIVTGENAAIRISKRMADLIAATDDGVVYVSRSHKSDPHVLSALERISISSAITMTSRVYVDLSTIAQIYEKCAVSDKKGQSKGQSNSRLQRDLIELLSSAAEMSASDVHIIVNSDRAEARVRVDGVMAHMADLQSQYGFELLAAAFALCDASDATYIPTAYQGARMSNVSTDLPKQVQSVRLQFNPLANGGRYLIMRLLYLTEGVGGTLERLGYIDKQIEQLDTITAKPVGINVVSGPTGSGKSTTMKVILERMIADRGGEINTITIEDPPEYVIPGAQQMPVTNARTQAERGEAFTQAIAAGLRSDPDVMMIGEIRDKASADLAVEGALSGHPVYASLHANSAMDILSRLRDIGVEDFKVFDPTVFSGLVGQRLVRRLCPHCRIAYSSPRGAAMVSPLAAARIEAMRALGDEIGAPRREIYLCGGGCDSKECSKGYIGRAVVAEVIIPDDDFMHMMREGRKRDARRYWFEEMEGIDLLVSGWFRVLRGEISPSDLENNVALMRPMSEHVVALRSWWPHFMANTPLGDVCHADDVVAGAGEPETDEPEADRPGANEKRA